MIGIKDFSIKKKLIAIQLLTVFIALLFFGIFVVFNVQHIIAACFVLIAGMIIILLLSISMQRTISNSILHLVEAAKEVSETGNYSIRVEKEGEDEIGVLYDSFNTMLEQIHKRQSERDKVEATLWESEEKLLRESEDLNIKIQEATRLKSQFLANMSHELRTPLNAIIGFTGIILQGIVGDLNDEQKKQLNMVYDSAKHLLGLINDVLDLSKIEAGKLDIVKEEFDVARLIEKVVKTVSPLAERKQLELDVRLSPEVGTIYSDKRRVEQILLNLVNNAIKFTERGRVRVEGAVTDERLEIGVQDTGIGIKPEDMDKLFQEFDQIKEKGVPKQEGTGLGLPISKKLSTILGGDVCVESEYGKGSKFTFTLPLKYKEVTG